MSTLAEPYSLLPHEVAEMLGVHRDTVTRLSDEDRLPCFRLPSGHRRYRRSDVEAFLAAAPSVKAS